MNAAQTYLWIQIAVESSQWYEESRTVVYHLRFALSGGAHSTCFSFECFLFRNPSLSWHYQMAAFMHNSWYAGNRLTTNSRQHPPELRRYNYDLLCVYHCLPRLVQMWTPSKKCLAFVIVSINCSQSGYLRVTRYYCVQGLESIDCVG